MLWALAVDGAVVVSRRSDNYELMLDQDVAIGYRTHTLDDVELYLEGSLMFPRPRRANGGLPPLLVSYAQANLKLRTGCPAESSSKPTSLRSSSVRRSGSSSSRCLSAFACSR